MEPMNAFLMQNRESFKSFIDEVCYVPPRLAASPSPPHTYSPGVLRADTNLSYATPITIMQRLPPTSREGFPSLPYLIDQARAYAELVHLWLETTTPMEESSDTLPNVKLRTEVLAAVQEAGGDLLAFHETCMALHKRTHECLSRAERTERPDSAASFQWEELFQQLKTGEANNGPETVVPIPIEPPIPAETSPPPPSARPLPLSSHSWTAGPHNHIEAEHHQPPTSHARTSHSQPLFASRPSTASTLHDNLRRAQLSSSRGSDSATASAVSSDVEHATTALPNYEREVRHQERREAAKVQIMESVEAARARKVDREGKRARTPIVARLGRKK